MWSIRERDLGRRRCTNEVEEAEEDQQIATVLYSDGVTRLYLTLTTEVWW